MKRPGPDDPRSQLKERIAPGIWVDQTDAAHFSIPEILDFFGWPHDAEHVALAKRAIRAVCKDRGWPFIEVDA